MVPESIRQVVASELRRLVAGEFPDLLVWVHDYGEDGAVLVPQPDAIWTHPSATAIRTDTGGWLVVVPLFTDEESPSDLSAEIVVDPHGVATIEDVHVL